MLYAERTKICQEIVKVIDISFISLYSLHFTSAILKVPGDHLHPSEAVSDAGRFVPLMSTEALQLCTIGWSCVICFPMVTSAGGGKSLVPPESQFLKYIP